MTPAEGCGGQEAVWGSPSAQLLSECRSFSSHCLTQVEEVILLMGRLRRPSHSTSISSPLHVISSKIYPQMMTISRLSLNFRHKLTLLVLLSFRLCPK